MLDWLKPILGDAYSEEIDKKISEEIGKIFVSRADFNTLNTEKKTLAETVKERDGQLEALRASTGDVEALKEQIAALQKDNAAAAKIHEDEIKRLRIDTAVELALSSAKAKSIKAARALLDLEKAELAEDGSVKGLAEQIKKLAGAPETGFLFDTEEKKPGSFKGLTPAQGSDGSPAAGMTRERLRAMSTAERYEFSVKHPEEYQKIYGGNV